MLKHQQESKYLKKNQQRQYNERELVLVELQLEGNIFQMKVGTAVSIIMHKRESKF